MLHCDHCDYFNHLGAAGSKTGDVTDFCEFEDYIFTGDINKAEMEYPCRMTSYQEYMQKEKKKQVSKLSNDDWRLLYKRSNLRTERVRISKPAKAV